MKPHFRISFAGRRWRESDRAAADVTTNRRRRPFAPACAPGSEYDHDGAITVGDVAFALLVDLPLNLVFGVVGRVLRWVP